MDHSELRRKTAPQHPGMLDGKRKRRTKVEMQRDRELEEQKKEALTQKKDSSVSRIASREDEMAEVDVNAGGAHPMTRNETIQYANTVTETASTTSNQTIQKKNGPNKATGSRQTNKQSAQKEQPKVHPLDQREANSDEGRNSMDVGIREAQTMAASHQTTYKGKQAPATNHSPRRLKRNGALLNINTDIEREICDKSGPATDPETTPRNAGKKFTNFDDANDFDSANGFDGANDFNDANGFDDANDLDYANELDDAGNFDDEPTPKKQNNIDDSTLKRKERENEGDEDTHNPRTKAPKTGIREQINARRGNKLARGPISDGKSTSEFSTTSTFVQAKKAGVVKNWVSEVEDSKRLKKPPTRINQKLPAPAATVRTTKLSGVVVSSTRNDKSKQKDSASYIHEDQVDDLEDEPDVGLFEESEEPERQAALNSPVKGRKRLTNADIIKTKVATPPPKAPARKKEKFTNNNLPPACVKYWQQYVIPTYLSIIASRTINEPWLIEVKDAEAILQKIWEFIYGASIPYTTNAEAAFSIADQRVMEWRGGFGSASLTLLHAFFDDQELNTTKKRREYAEIAIDLRRFLYLQVEESEYDDKPKRNGIFRGPLVIQTFATHFNSIRGSTDVPSLASTTSMAQKLHLGDMQKPEIALALSVTAVQRALTLWRDGHITCESIAEHKSGKRNGFIIKATNRVSGKESKETDFNHDNWGKVANMYLSPIRNNLQGSKKNEKKFMKVIQDAMAYVKASRTGESSAAPSVLQDDEQGDILQLKDDDSDFDMSGSSDSD